MKNWKKMTAAGITCVMALGMIGTGASAEEKTYEPTTLTFWNGFTSTDGEVLQQIVDEFNETNEWNITIEMDVMPWDTFNEKLPAAIAAGNAPDFVLCSSGYYPSYIKAGSFQDVSDFYDLPEVNKDDFDPNVVDLLYYDDLSWKNIE